MDKRINEDLPPVMPPSDYGYCYPGMGPIRFPQDGHIGSGDVISGTKGKKKKKRKVYTEMPSHTVLSYEEFMKIAGDEQN